LKYIIEFLIFKILLFIIKILPKKAVALLGRSFGMFCYYIGLRRKVVGINLSIAFKNQLNKKEENLLTKKIYKNIGSIMFEVLLLNFISSENLDKYIEIEGKEIFEEAINEGRGVVMAGSHFGNWELLSAGINHFIKPFYAYTGLQKNQLFDKSLNQIRTKFGMVAVSKSKTATRDLMKALKNKEIIGILGDLNVPNESLFVDFFDKKASMGVGLPAFTVSKKAPLIFTSIVRTGLLKHKGKIVRIPYTLCGDNDKDIQTVAQLISSEIEKNIKDYPDHYFWFNRRWKTRPPEEKNESVYQ